MKIEGLPLQPDLSYIEYHVKILDEKERVTRNNLGTQELYSGALPPSSP